MAAPLNLMRKSPPNNRTPLAATCAAA